jgi:hypothetical protein
MKAHQPFNTTENYVHVQDITCALEAMNIQQYMDFIDTKKSLIYIIPNSLQPSV